MKILGHRGNGRTTQTPFADGKAPEHTLASFLQAAENGADGVEFDVFLSRDGIPVILDKNEIMGHVASDLTRAEIKSLKLEGGHSVPTLEEALLTLSEISVARKGFAINIELKGPSVVEPTLKVVNHVAEHHQLNKSEIHYSSFDRDKLSLVRKLDANANIQPTIATVHLFDQHNVQMPGYHVPAHAAYNKAALAGLEKYIQQKGCSAIDTPTSDIRPELIDVAARQKVGFCTHPTGPRRREAADYLVNSLRLLDSFARHSGSSIYFKVDDIVQARSMIADHHNGFPISHEKMERVMGLHFLS